LFFSLSFFDIKNIYITIIGFSVFSLLSSVVYIFNDIRDIETDRLHSTKRFRPLAAKTVSPRGAIIAAIVLCVIIVALLLLLFKKYKPDVLPLIGTLLLYTALNIGYSLGLKNIPIVDISILASGFVLRALFGAVIIGVDVSVWLYLTITLGAYYLGFGKRRNEINRNETGTRGVIRLYTHNFLDKNMYLCQALCVAFYALWSIDNATVKRFNSNGFVYTIPLLLIILFKYNLSIEADSDGDPTSVILHDKVLILLCLIYAASAFCIIYFNRRTI
jgi:4-hydroxybenzoate polyprenyltransferase